MRTTSRFPRQTRAPTAKPEIRCAVDTSGHHRQPSTTVAPRCRSIGRRTGPRRSRHPAALAAGRGAAPANGSPRADRLGCLSRPNLRCVPGDARVAGEDARAGGPAARVHVDAPEVGARCAETLVSVRPLDAPTSANAERRIVVRARNPRPGASRQAAKQFLFAHRCRRTACQLLSSRRGSDRQRRGGERASDRSGY